MEAGSIEPSIAAIRRWSGIDCPNEAAHHGLADLLGIVAELERLRGGMAFEDEPSSFELALQQCKEEAE